MENCEFIPSGDGEILTVFHSGSDAAPLSGCAVLVAPLHEEKKAAHRPLVDLARALSSRGMACLRYDARGTGDSSGDAADVTFKTLTEDLETAIARARFLSGQDRVTLLGVRLGADVAARVGLAHASVERAVLCVPLISGERYLREVRLRARIRGAMTRVEGGGDADAAAEGIDYGGHILSPQFIADLESYDLMADIAPVGSPVVCVDIRGRNSVTAAMGALAERLRQRQAEVEVHVVIDEPFWNALGPVVPRVFMEKVVGILLSGEGAR